jgi:C4-dicarboxylate-specific signal transduction histidine kinase
VNWNIEKYCDNLWLRKQNAKIKHKKAKEKLQHELEQRVKECMAELEARSLKLCNINVIDIFSIF